jgi:D-alanine-D-alanine ligase
VKGLPPALLLYNIDPSWPLQDIQDCQTSAQRLMEGLEGVGHPIQEVCLQTVALEDSLDGYDPQAHLIFNWCEELPGMPHSGSQIAQILDRMGFTYTGADAEGLALSQDKGKVKTILKAQDVPTPQWEIVTRSGFKGWNTFPAIVKPAFEHCSYGVTRDAVVLDPDELVARVEYVLETFEQPVLIEEFIDGREFHLAVLGNGTLHALPTAEMDFSAFSNVKDRLCTYDSKFVPESVPYNLIEIRLPASLTSDEQGQIEAIAFAAYRATGCRDYARMDIRLRDGIFYVLDVNPNADISPDTSFALAAEEAGLSYGQLGSMLLNLAGLRHPVYCKMLEE